MALNSHVGLGFRIKLFFAGKDAARASVEGEPPSQLSYTTGRVPLAKILGSGDDGKTDRKMLLSFTCKVCSSRNTKFISHLVSFV